MNVTHYDLFAGIGGFSYALDTIFAGHRISHIFCEWEAFPTAVLKKHWPNALYYGDIADLAAATSAKRLARGTGSKRQRPSTGPAKDITIVTGGFPCQPFSQAGRRKGTADNRYKWPEMLRVIQNVRPDWIVAENVRGLVTWNEGMVLETVCADLESEGYEVQPLIVPACAIGAPHRRDRVWIIGTNARQQLRQSRGAKAVATHPAIRSSCTVYDQRGHQPSWAKGWREVAFATCHDGVGDGLPRRMDAAAISAARHRKERLKACGNAIVPQLAMEIFSAIKHAQSQNPAAPGRFLATINRSLRAWCRVAK